MANDIRENRSNIKSRYRHEIDGLRGFAVVAVIINHFNKDILPSGYLGVDIFFVISGFVVTSSLYQRPSKNFKDFISGFFERRIKRIVPALSLFVLMMSIAICLFNPSPSLSLKTGITSLFGLSNLYLLKQSTDYFAQSTELNVFTQTWSLGVEEQFYILFPFLIWFSGFGRQTKNGAHNLFLIVSTLAITSLIGFLYLYPINQSAAYFLMPTRFWEMATGCLLFIGLQKRKSIEQLIEKVPPLPVMVLIVGTMYLPISWATASTVAVVTLSAVLIASLNKPTFAFKIFTHPKIVYTGLISYSLYLWHWGILSISHWTIGIHWWSIPFQVTLMWGLAIASYQYIEMPIRKSNWLKKRWEKIVFGGGVIITLSGILITLEKPLKGQLYKGQIIQNKEPTFLKGEECLENISELTHCYLIDNKSKQTLWLLGDSHANYLALAGEKVANSLKKNLKLYTTSSTPFPPISRYQKRSKKNDLRKLDDQRYVKKDLYRQIKVGDVILLSMRSPFYFGGSYYWPQKNYRFFREDGSLLSRENHFNEWISALVNLANIAEKKGAKVIIQTPTPEWEQNYMIPKCSKSKLQWFNSLQKIDCQIKSEFFIDKETGSYKNLFEKLHQLSTSHKNIYLFDTYKVVCPESKCNFTRDGIDIYYDDHHISYEWARDFLAPEIKNFINAIETMEK